MTYPAIIECGECSSRNIARKLSVFPYNTWGPLICLDCRHEETLIEYTISTSTNTSTDTFTDSPIVSKF